MGGHAPPPAGYGPGCGARRPAGARGPALAKDGLGLDGRPHTAHIDNVTDNVVHFFTSFFNPQTL